MTTATMKRPAAPAITLTKLFIDNNFVDPVGGKTSTPTTRHRRCLPRSPKLRRRRGPGREGRAQGAGERPWAKMDAADAVGHVQASRLIEEERRGTGRAGVAQLRQNDQGLAWGHDRRGEHAALLRRLGRQDRGPHRSGARQLPQLHPAPAVGVRRPDSSLELPLLMLAWKWGPALVCGNTLVMKPAEQPR